MSSPHFLTSLTTLAFVVLTTLVILRYAAVPLLVRALTSIRIRTISFRSIKGIEWTADKGPRKGTKFRLGRIGWQRSKRAGALLSIVVEGINIELREKQAARPPSRHHQGGDDHRPPPPKPRKPSHRIRASALWCATRLARSAPWILHLVDIRFDRVHVIFDNNQLELRIQDVCASLDVAFEQAPELLDLPVLEKLVKEGIPAPSPSPMLHERPPLFEANDDLLARRTPTPSSDATSNVQVPRRGSGGTPGRIASLRQSRPVRLFVRAMGRASGSATMSVSIGPTSLRRRTMKGDEGAATAAAPACFELKDASTLGATVRFGGSNIGTRSVETKLHVSPLQVAIDEVLALRSSSKPSKETPLPPRSSSSSPRGGDERQYMQARILNAIHLVDLSMPSIEFVKSCPSASSAPLKGSLEGLSVSLSSAGADDDDDLREVFGKHSAPAGFRYIVFYDQALVRREEQTVFQHRRLSVQGCTTWLPGCHRPSADANDALVQAVVQSGDVSVNVDLAILKMLERPTSSRSQHSTLKRPLDVADLPRIHFALEQGPIRIRVSHDASDVTMRLDGSYIGLRSTHSLLQARRRDRTDTKKAFRQELDMSPEEATTTPRRFRFKPGHLEDGLSHECSWTVGGHVGATSIDAGGCCVGRIGRASIDGHGSIRADAECYSAASLLHHVNVDIVDGVNLALWEEAAVISLLSIAQALPKSSSSSGSQRASLPGLTARLHLGFVTCLVADIDPNPKSSRAARGMAIAANTVLDVATFSDASQTRRSRHDVSASERARFRLLVEAGEQARAAFRGPTSYCLLHLDGALVQPVQDAATFRHDTLSQLGHVPPRRFFAQRAQPPSQAGWDFQRQRSLPKPDGVLSNAANPLEIDPEEEAHLPLIKIGKLTASARFQKIDDTPATINVSVRSPRVMVTFTMQHAYCAMLAIKRLKSVKSQRRANAASSAVRPRLSIEAYVDSALFSAALPLGERIFVHTQHVYVASNGQQSRLTLESGMSYVPSPRAPYQWEEFSRMKNLTVTLTRDTKTQLKLSGDALRIRIPFRYELSRLILNLATTAKSLKLLNTNMRGGGEFSFEKTPVSEEPKHLPDVQVDIKYLSMEIKDDPLETKLNLIWRVGLNEQIDRLEREAAFAAKVAVITGSPADKTEVSHRWGLTAEHSVSVDEARTRLDEYNALQWTRRFRSALHEQHRREEAIVSKISGIRLEDHDLPISVLPPERFAPLFRTKLVGLSLRVSDPGLDRNGVLHHMEELAGAFPKGTEFSLLVPLAISASVKSLDCSLRDYPLPLLRVPSTDTGESALHFSTTLVAAEELAGEDSYFLLPSQIMPDLQLQIAKTIMPVKTYARPTFSIQSSASTDFTWGQSYQPALQDLTKVFDTFSHPPRDPSPKPGFWDKFRLVLHWQVSLDFAGPAHLHFKGSRDPYKISDLGAGFVLAWMGNVRVTIGHPNEQRELIQIHSDQMVYSIPDLSAYIDNAATGVIDDNHLRDDDDDGVKLLDRRGNKTCAKFVNGVRVGFGFRFERTCRPYNCTEGCTGDPSDRKCRIFDFRPHHSVKLINKESLERKSASLDHTLDSFEGFRSDFIHFSPSITTLGAPDAEECSSFHLTPKGFTHFFAWWRLFKQHALSLPIRQGKLFPRSPPPSKKFGRSVATIKYRFDIAPLFISHIYPQYDKDDWSRGQGTSLGIKARIGRFQADAHQREQQRVVKKARSEGDAEYGVIKHKAMYAADVVLDNVRLRAVRTVFQEQDQDLCQMAQKDPAHDQPRQKASELGAEERSWFAFDDYVDTDTRPTDQDPRMEIYDIGDCPKFHYSKWTLAHRSPHNMLALVAAGQWRDPDLESSKFGQEKTHFCLLGEDSGVERSQHRFIDKRIDELKASLADAEGGSATEKSLLRSIRTLVDHKSSMASQLREPLPASMRDPLLDDPHLNLDRRKGMLTREGAEFENVYHIHCPRLALSNSSRNIVLKYYYSSRQRKGFDYHMTNTALKVLKKQLVVPAKPLIKPDAPSETMPVERVADRAANAVTRTMFKLFPDKHHRQTEASDARPSTAEARASESLNPSEGLPSTYETRKSHFLALMKPQIALSSEVDKDATVLVTVESATFRGFTVIDPDYQGDTVNAHVMHRNYALLDGLQSFYPSPAVDRKPYAEQFVPLEVMLDSGCSSTEFDRIVSRTDGSLHYDKFNQLRLKNSIKGKDESDVSAHLLHSQDLALLNVPRFVVDANSKHYGAIYNVITDLMLYQDPDQRKRSDRIKDYKNVFDVRDAYRSVSTVSELQKRIRELQALARGYEDQFEHLSYEDKQALNSIRGDLLESIEGLNVIFDAVPTARNDTHSGLKASLRMEASSDELNWHMRGKDSEQIAKLTIKGVDFSWTRKTDGSTVNKLVIDDLTALNSSPHAVYAELVGKDRSSPAATGKKHFAEADWSVLAPVGGIGIIERLSLDLHPLRLQLEHKLEKQLSEYVFQDKSEKRSKKARSDSIAAGSGEPSRNCSSTDLTSLSPAKAVRRKASVSSLHSQIDILRTAEAEEMRTRASQNRTFGSIEIKGTTFVASYITGIGIRLSGIHYTAPDLTYRNETMSYQALVQRIKKGESKGPATIH